jgi:energy-converting hydrogenase A subunit E
LLDVYVWFYMGCALVIIGSIATVIGPGVKDPLVRTLNTEISAVGVSLIFLTYNHTIAINVHCSNSHHNLNPVKGHCKT